MLEAIGDFLHSNSIATFNKANEALNQIYIGQIDLSKNTCIGLYNDLQVTEVRNISAEEYEEYGFTILVHWSSNYNTAFEKAKDIYDLFRSTDRFIQGGYTFWNIRCLNGQPVYVETRNDVYEFVLNILVKVNI